jgi:hypothetical protein
MDMGKAEARKRLWRTEPGRSAAKPISYILWALACATYGFAGETADSLFSFRSLTVSVKKVLNRFGRDSFRIEYLFNGDDLLHPGNLEGSGWDANVRDAWVYVHESGSGCREIKDIKFIGPGWRGFMIDSEDHSGDTTHISGWEMLWGSGISFFAADFGITKSGHTVYSGWSGEFRTGGSLSRISRPAIYFDGIDVYPVAEKGIRDSIIYEDSSGNRFGCAQTSSIGIVLKGVDVFFGQAYVWPEKGIRTIRCETVPSQCQPDTGEILLREINKTIRGYWFTIRNDNRLCHEAVFRTRAGCKRYAHRCAKMDREGNP